LEKQRRRAYGNSLLYEVQKKGRDKESEADYTQEWQTSSSRCLLYLWNKGVSDRENLNIIMAGSAKRN
jgi:hypothetical protein